MNKIIFIFLSVIFSLTLISCSKKDDSSSSGSSETTSSSQTFVDANFCRLTKNMSSRNSSLIVNETELNARSSKRKGRDIYVDKSAVAQYETDDYLLIDEYDSTYSIDGKTYTDGGTEGVNLSDNAPLLGNRFTQELRFYYDPVGVGGGQLLGNESFRAPSISFHNYGTEIRYGFFPDGAVSGNRKKVKNYIQDSRPVMGAHGAKALVIGLNISNISKLEGIPPERVVIMEFEDVEAAQKAFQSNQVNEEKLEGGVDRVMFVLEGV